MQINLPEDLVQRVSDRVAGGQYATREEVLRVAMDALDAAEEQRLLRWRERNSLAEAQSRRGLSQPLDEAAVLARLRTRLADDGVIETT